MIDFFYYEKHIFCKLFILITSMAKLILYCFFTVLTFGGCKKYDTEVNKNPIPDVKATFSANIDGSRVRWTADSAGFTGISFVDRQTNSDSS